MEKTGVSLGMLGEQRKIPSYSLEAEWMLEVPVALVTREIITRISTCSAAWPTYQTSFPKAREQGGKTPVLSSPAAAG